MKLPFLTTSFARKEFLAAAILALLTILTYVGTLNVPFVFDDSIRITENPAIRIKEISPDSLMHILKGPGFRPLADFSFAVNYLLHGFDVRGYHIVNLAIHFITAMMVFLVARHTLRLSHLESDFICFFAAAVWLVHPLHTQSVTYIIQRMNSLATMFFMLSLLFFIKARLSQQKGAKKSAISGFIFCGLAGLCGLAAKETIAILPVVLLLYEWIFFQQSNPVWLKKRVLWIIPAAAAIVALSVFYMGGNPLDKLDKMYGAQLFTPAQRLLTETLVIIYYISLLLFPHPARLKVVYDFPLSNALTDPMTTFLATGTLLVMLVAAVYSVRRHPLFSFVIFWFMITLLIESSIIGLELIYEHRTYLPSIFPAIGLTVLIFRYIRPKPVAVGIVCTIIAICGLWTYQRNGFWKTELALWMDNIAKSPEEALCANGIAAAYNKTKNFEAAIAYYEKALAIAVRRGGKPQIPLNNIGEILLHQNKPRQAMAFLQKAISYDPNYEKAHTNLGAALLRLGKIDTAIESSQRALEINPQSETAYNNLGNALFLKGNIYGAVDAYRRALSINPDYQEARANLDKVLWAEKKYGGFIGQLESLATRHPDDPGTAFQLGQLSLAAGMTDQAVFWYERTLSIDPGRPTYLNALSTALLALGNTAGAAGVLEQLALQIPDNPTVFYNLACLYARMENREQALAALKKAVDRGYDRWEHLRTDKDLESIRQTDYVQGLIGEHHRPKPRKSSSGFGNN